MGCLGVNISQQDAKALVIQIEVACEIKQKRQPKGLP
jgi:hypothetical protein